MQPLERQALRHAKMVHPQNVRFQNVRNVRFTKRQVYHTKLPSQDLSWLAPPLSSGCAWQDPIRTSTLAFGLCGLTHNVCTKKQFQLIPQGRILFFSVTQEAFIVESFCKRYTHEILKKMNLALEWILWSNPSSYVVFDGL